MSLRASRRIEQEQGPEEWIWGNTRGGGGAPLKSVEGGQITNLRNVLKGNTQVDVSPKGKRYSSYDDEDDDSGRYSPIKGLENANYGNFSPNRGKKLNELNTTNFERDEKLRKEREYQEALRQQILEKQRVKDQEKAEREKQKKAELNEYLKTHYKGPIPDYLQRQKEENEENRSRNNDNNRRRYEDDSRRHPSHNKSRDDGRPDRDYRDRRDREPGYGSYSRGENYSEDDEDSTRRGRRGGERNHGLDKLQNEDNSYRNDNIHGRNQNPRNRQSVGRSRDDDDNERKQPARNRSYRDEDDDISINNRKNDRRVHDNRGDDGWVSRIEHDELSQLCDQLMMKQTDLEEQIRNQNKLIKELREAAKGGKVATNAKIVQPPKALNNFNGLRSQSADVRKKADSKVAVKDNKVPASQRRPASMQTTENTKPNNRKAQQLPTNNNKGPEKKQEVKNPPRRQNTDNESRNVDARKKPSPIGGFQKLQLAAQNGPKIVTYDDEGPPASNRSKMELKAQSEHLYIGNNIDYIGEDQLDRLLIKGKRAN